MEWVQSIFTIPEGATLLTIVLFIAKRLVALIGSFIIVWGACAAFYHFLSQYQDKKDKIGLIDLIRLRFGRIIILGLEFIVASDVIETTTAPDYYSVGILAALVGIRTLLTFFMNRELNQLGKTKMP